MKDGRDRGVIYWTLNYRAKFIRTLWMIPITIIVIILFMITSWVPKSITITVTLVLLITLISQLAYTYYKWQQEEKASSE